MERIVEILTEFTLPVPTCDPAALTEEFNEILKDPSAMEYFLQIATTNENPVIRKSSYVYIRKLANAQEDEVKISLKEPLMHLFETETDHSLYIYIINCIAVIGTAIYEASEFPEITQVGTQLCGNPETIKEGLTFLINLYEFMPEGDKESTFDGLVQLAAENFTSEDMDLRILSFDFFSELIFSSLVEDDGEDIDELLVSKIPGIAEMVLQVYTNALSVLNDKELTSLNRNLSDLFFDRYSCFEEVSKQCFQMALEAIGNDEIPVEIRNIIVQLLDNAPQVYPEYFSECFQDYFAGALNLSLAACQANREETEYVYPLTFISNLAKYSGCQVEGFFQYIIEVVSPLIQGDEASVQVALSLLAWITPECADDINNEPETFLGLIQQGLTTEDPLIAKAAASLLEEVAAKATQAIAANFDELVDLVFAKTTEDIEFIVTLERVIASGHKCYSKLPDLLQFLIPLIGEEEFMFNENAIGCIAKALEKFTGTDESLFETIFPVIVPFIEDMSDIGVTSEVFLCISSLIKVSPASVLGSLETILPFIVEKMNDEDVNIYSCRAVTEALKGIVSMFSVSIESVAGDIVNGLMRLIEIENPKLRMSFDDAEEDVDTDAADLEERNYIRMKQNAIVSLGMMIEVMSPIIAESIPSIIEKMESMITSPYPYDQMSAAVAMKHSIPVIYEYEFSPTQFVDPERESEEDPIGLIDIIRREISVGASAQLFRLLSSIISSLSPEFTVTHLENIGTLLMDAVQGKLQTTQNLINEEQTIVPPLFECINRFILLVGPAFEPFFEGFAQLMLEFIEGKSMVMKGHAIRALATLTINFQVPEIAGPAIENALLGMTLSNVSLKTNSFNAIGFLIRSNREVMNEHSAEIIEAVNEVISGEEPEGVYEAALAAWCTLFVVFRIPVEAEAVVAAFQHLQFRTQSISRSSDHIVAFSRFIYYACAAGVTGIEQQVALVATIALSSTDFEIARIGQEACAYFVSVLGQNTEEIEGLTGMNQRKARIILSRIQE